MNSSSKKETWLYNAKAIGIILVIIGHTRWGYLESIIRIIYSFHMPLFFFLSGYVYKRIDSKRFYKITNKLFVRYLLYSLLFSVSFLLVSGKKIKVPELVKNVIFGYFTAGDPATTLWFLLTLYVTTLIFALLERTISDKRILLIGSTIIMSIGYVLIIYLVRLPLRVQTSFVCLLFFAVGWLIKENNLQKKTDKDCLLLIIVTIITLCASLFNGRVDLGSDIIGRIPLFIIGAFSGITMIVLISRNIYHFPIVEIIARNSIVIYLFHIFPVVILREVFIKVGITGSLNKIISHLITYILIIVIICSKELVRKKSNEKN